TGLHRPGQLAADDLWQIFGRDPQRGAQHDDVIDADYVATVEVGYGDQIAPADPVHLVFDRLAPLDPVAEPALDVTDLAHHRCQLTRLDCERLIGALHAAVEGQVLLDHVGAHGDC